MPMFLPTTLSGGTLVANQPSQRLDGFQRTRTRCPGGTVQPPPDGSAPVRVAGACESATTPPGP
jgi:hypothetical protein